MGVAEKKNLLFIFPPEIWAIILNCLPGEVLFRFKLTGSTLLWRQISAARYVKSLFLGGDGLHFKRPPTCLNELFGVEELKISNVNELWWQNIGLKLDQLPKTLRKLVLSGPKLEIASIFRQPDGTRFSLDEHLPLLEELSFPLEWLQKTALVSSNLKVLRCRSWDYHCQLPPSLIHLHLTETIYPGPENEIRVPSQLESIFATNFYMAAQLIPYLPPSLVTLDIYGNPPNLASADLLIKLPPNLTKLSVTISRPPPGSAALALTSESLSWLSHRLTDLDIGLLPAVLWKALPPGLLRLRLSGLSGNDTITPRTLPNPKDKDHPVHFNSIPIHDLPKTITWLSLLFIARLQRYTVDFDALSDDAVCDAKPIPFKFSYLRIANAQLSTRACRHLSQTTFLTEMDLQYLDLSLVKHLPKTLTKLIAMKVFLMPGLFANLPKGLTFLHLGASTTPYDTWTDPSTSLSCNILAMHEILLPSQTSDDFWTGEACLPPNLTTLGLATRIEHGDLFARQDMQKLTRLTLQGSIYITNLGIPHLSRELVQLHMPFARTISGKCFKDLPKSLTWLSLEATWEVYDEDIQHLPLTLEYLNLQSASSLTDSCLKSLPRSLKSLDLRQCQKITNSHLSDLPISLQLYPEYFKKAQEEAVAVITPVPAEEPVRVSNKCSLQ